MNKYSIINTEEVIKLLKDYRYNQLHIHHTWSPAHSSFNGSNHIQLQLEMEHLHVVINQWDDIGQHLSLMPDGSWVTGRAFDSTPASIRGWNTGALAIEMVGNFDIPGTGVENPLGYDILEGKQKQSILAISKYFGERFGYDKIVFHNEGPEVTKTCPGTSLNKDIFIEEVKGYNKL